MRIGNNLSDLNDPQVHGEEESHSIFNELFVRYPIMQSFHAYGFGQDCQLNVGEKQRSDDKWTPVSLPELNGIQVKQFEASKHHSLVIYLTKSLCEQCFRF
jgi:hypothetical protein